MTQQGIYVGGGAVIDTDQPGAMEGGAGVESTDGRFLVTFDDVGPGEVGDFTIPEEQVALDGQQGKAFREATKNTGNNRLGMLADNSPRVTIYEVETGRPLVYPKYVGRAITVSVLDGQGRPRWSLIEPDNPPNPWRPEGGTYGCWLGAGSLQREKYAGFVHFPHVCESRGFWAREDAREHVELYHRNFYRAVQEHDETDKGDRQLEAIERQTAVLETIAQSNAKPAARPAAPPRPRKKKS